MKPDLILLPPRQHPKLCTCRHDGPCDGGCGGELRQLVEVRCGPQPPGRWSHIEVQCACGRVSRDEFVCPACLSPLSRTGTRITPDYVAFKRGDEVIVRGEDA